MLDIRRDAGFTSDDLFAATGIQRQKISHIETANRRVDSSVIETLLRQLKVADDRFARVMDLARGSARPGWWERFDDEMGSRQARTADLESGAKTIFQFQPFLIPGLLQTQAFAAVRADADRSANSRRFSTARMLEARAQRQSILSGADATPLEVVLDESVLHRTSAAPTPVMHEQLDHLVGAALNRPSVTIRILPFVTRLSRHAQARTAFSRYSYTCPAEMVVINVDTNLEDRLLYKTHDVALYNDLADELQRVALSPADSVEHLAAAADACSKRR
ncbi:helix-turn-helix transcriptional regulator [Actinoplanes sp. LDG1-06]|uniref:Helix-turn-helix transcriptional regulator n=1 Tax=Paractinoplanes ovalisporus TaxID=2810368 RepID=A0ABS2AUD9_9ACTN|nr:Scr1 family TA system antitoxin-like transcriptional regulator [Actinoplanes ovalisporus]MBM2623431.1 helix-turn-helix transcriptional regulator [Actinoplanes ovalisporus]